MRAGDNEWDVPPGVISDLQMHAAAAVRFPQGWAASDMRRKYLPGSVATDPKPKPEPPPTGGAEIEELRLKLAEAEKERDAAKQAATFAERDRNRLEDEIRKLAERMEKGDNDPRDGTPAMVATPKTGKGVYADALRQVLATLKGLAGG
jgi:hypothetical protein